MPRIDTDEWIDSHAASQILTVNSGHAVSDAYVRRLADSGRIRKKMLHERLSLYNKRDVESYRVQKRRQKKTKDMADVLLEPWRVGVMTDVIAEKWAEKTGETLDEEQKAVVREELLAALVKMKETGEVPKPDENM